MTIDTLLESEDMYVLFDGCPTCHPESSRYLDECRTLAQETQRRLHVTPSGSRTATLMRTIAGNQGQPVEYPMMLMDGTIRHNLSEIIPKHGKDKQ